MSDPGTTATDVQIALYRWAGTWGPFKVNISCGECSLIRAVFPIGIPPITLPFDTPPAGANRGEGVFLIPYRRPGRRVAAGSAGLPLRSPAYGSMHAEIGRCPSRPIVFGDGNFQQRVPGEF